MTVSVVVPTYNSRTCIKRAVDSILGQTVQDWELVLIDDASTDGTMAYVSSLYGNDPRFTFLVNEQNRGPSASRNLGISVAQGEWIALLDSDDAWRPERLQQLLAVATNYDFVADNVMTYDAKVGAETGPYYETFQSERLNTEDYLIGWVGDHAMDGGYLKPLMRRSFLVDSRISYDNSLRHGEDYLLYCEALCKGARFRLINSCGYLYSTPVGRISNQWSPHTHTVPNPAAMATALMRLKGLSSDALSSREHTAFTYLIERLATINPWWEFEDALRTQQYLRCLPLFRHSVVRREFYSAFLRKLRGVTPKRPDL